MYNRSWVEVDLTQIKQNLRIYKDSVAPNATIMAVVKADAYGHGDIEVVKLLQCEGVEHFAVANIAEAIRLREHGIAGQILILGYTPVEELDDLVAYKITQALISEEYAEALANTGKNVTCQFALDTGMNRIGIDADDPVKCEKIIRKFAERLKITGVFTHLCIADLNTEEATIFTREQIRKYEAVVERIKDLNLPYNHCLNSAGGLWHRASVNAFIRLGIVLYGLKPDYANQIPKGIEPALSWKSTVAMVKIVHVGETIGYGRSYRAEKEMKIGTVPTGYADGYNRLLSNIGYVLINGKRAPITGRICMDQMMVDVTEIDDVKMGTEVVLLGRSGEEILTADNMAQQIGTIGYEIVCDISKRVERRYI